MSAVGKVSWPTSVCHCSDSGKLNFRPWRAGGGNKKVTVRILERFRPLSQRWLSVFVFGSVCHDLHRWIVIDRRGTLDPRFPLPAWFPAEDASGYLISGYRLWYFTPLSEHYRHRFSFSNCRPSEPKVSTFSIFRGDRQAKVVPAAAERHKLLRMQMDERRFRNNQYSALCLIIVFIRAAVIRSQVLYNLHLLFIGRPEIRSRLLLCQLDLETFPLFVTVIPQYGCKNFFFNKYVIRLFGRTLDLTGIKLPAFSTRKKSALPRNEFPWRVFAVLLKRFVSRPPSSEKVPSEVGEK